MLSRREEKARRLQEIEQAGGEASPCLPTSLDGSLEDARDALLATAGAGLISWSTRLVGTYHPGHPLGN